MPDDFFGFLDPNVPKALTPPEGYEGVHQAGMSWARQGDRTANTSWMTVGQYNHIIAQFRGLATLAGVDVSDLIQSSPLLLRTFIQRVVLAYLSGVEVGELGLMPKDSYDADNDGKVDLAAGGTGVAATDLADLRGKLGITSAIDTAISALGAVVVNKGAWDASAGTFPGGGAAKNGWAYIVSVGGTVGGVAFTVGDRVLALADNASTSTYAGNWLKLDYTDQVLSVADMTGAISVSALKAALGLDNYAEAFKEYLLIACGDETTPVDASTGKITFRMPYAMTLSAVRASLVTAQTSGSIFTVDINKAGTSILSTKLTIDNTEKTSKTAVTAAVISTSALADDDEISIDIDQIGDGTAAGLKVMLIGTR